MKKLKKALHHYKAQNSHLNHFNDQLVSTNRRLREDLEEINTNYAKMAQPTEEVVRKRKLAQEKNEELSRKNQELQGKWQAMEKEYS